MGANRMDRATDARLTKIRVHSLATEILRQTPGILTMAEAVERAKAIVAKAEQEGK